jgi:phosphoribosyl-AMP cyclohydrolase
MLTLPIASKVEVRCDERLQDPGLLTMFTELETAAAGTRRPLAAVLDGLAWNDAGLVPAIAQDHESGRVLMLAWMNRTALNETLTTGRVCYYSRSRRRLWRKGEESGHVQQLKSCRIDCDGDVLLLTVAQTGPACHSGRPHCFYLSIDGDEVVVTSDAT